MHYKLLVGASVLFSASVSAQGLSDHYLYYKFDAGSGNAVINYGAASGAPGDGLLTSSATIPASWPSSKFGGALSGSDFSSSSEFNYVRSRFTGPVTGSFTIAWFQKQRSTVAPGSKLSHFCGGLGNFRIYTGGNSGTGLCLGDWGGVPQDLMLGMDLQGPSSSTWMHVAIVVDTAAKAATWYVDGLAQPVIPLTSTTTNISGTEMTIGRHTSNLSTCGYDLDEFRFMDRAATAGEIRTMMNAPSAADAIYGRGCGAKLTTLASPPAIGNYNYQLQIKGPIASPYLIAIGDSRTLINFDLGLLEPSLQGCRWETNMLTLIPGATNGSGVAGMNLPIFRDTGLVGLNLYNQALVLPFAGLPLTTNGLVTAIQW